MDELLDSTGAPLPKNWLGRIVIIWTGQAASVFATCAASFAAIWFITETTSSAVWLSLAAASSLLPAALLSPFGGVIADRFDRKRVMIVADGAAGFFSLVLAVVAIVGLIDPAIMLVLLAVRGAAQAFHGPALTALIPRLVPESQLVRINSLDQSITSLSSIAGPVLGIFLYTIIGFHGVMIFDAACAAFACLCLAFVRVAHNATTEKGASVLTDLKEGALFIMHDKGLFRLMILVMVTMLLFMPASSLSPLMTYDHFGGDGYQASIVEAAFGIGLLVGSVAIFVWGGGKRLVPIIVCSGVMLGLAIAACGLLRADQFPLFVVLVGLAAVGMGGFNAPIMPILQKKTPENMIGRVMGIFLTGSALAAPIGLSFSGFIAEGIGLPTWFIVCGVLVALCCALGGCNRAIRGLDDVNEGDARRE